MGTLRDLSNCPSVGCTYLSLCCGVDLCRMQLQQKLLEGQEQMANLQTGREQVYTKLGEWFK